MSLDQKRARVFGVLYLITFVTSITAALLYQTVLRHPVSYIAGAGQDTQVLLGALLELLLIIVSGTAVMFTGNHPSSALHSLQAILTIPEFAWELFLGVYCTIWGFRPDAPVLSGSAR